MTDMSDNYALRKSDLERERLNVQHRYFTELLGGRLVVDTNVKIGPGDRVLDAGTGTASWLLALAKEIPESVELVGYDISMSLFPSELPRNMKLYELSTLNLPSDWENSFNFINNRFLCIAFTVSQWQTALSELFRVLKPGGTVQFMEWGDIGSLDDENIPPVFKEAMGLMYAVMDHRQVLGYQCGDKLPDLSKEAGFSDVQVEISKAPVGKQWGETGIAWAKIVEALLRGIGVTLLAEGGLGICKSQAEVDERIDNAKKAWDEISGPRLYCPVYVITAKKAS